MWVVPRTLQRWVLVDAAVLVGSLWLAYLLRFDFAIPASDLRAALLVTPFVLAVQLGAACRTGVYLLVGRYVSLDDMGAFGRAAGVWMVAMLAARLLLPAGPWRIPLSVILIDTLLGVAGLVGLRLARRIRYESSGGDSDAPQALQPVLLVGAGDAGVQAAREIHRHGSTGLSVVGFVDDDPMKVGSVVAGVEVLGTSTDIPRLVASRRVDHVIVTIVDATPAVMRRIVDICKRVPVRVRTVPGLIEIVRGSVAITKFRDVGVEDLLGRDPVNLDPVELAGYLGGRTVMVTGAGGSIGSELARQIAAFGPSALLLVDRFEGALFHIHRDLGARYPRLVAVPLVADINDGPRMRSIFESYRPEVVVHAAAHKHVGMMEQNPDEAIKNNTFGTRSVAEMAAEFGVGSFVLVSTDKAVHPSSIMGASKRLAEMVIQDLDHRPGLTRFIAVRFGNVMGSSGSVIPIFKDQVRRGGPVTVTHPDATRYFMTIPEAARLVLTAGTIGRGGEIMVLDMGQPVRILDLARNLITLSGFSPDGDIPITFTGLGPGEKMTEDLYAAGEEMELTRHPKIFVGRGHGVGDVGLLMRTLRDLVDRGDGHGIRCALHEALLDSQLLGVDRRVISPLVPPSAVS